MARGELPRHDGLPAVSPLANTGFRIELETAFNTLTVSGMTFVTVFHKHRANLAFKEVDTSVVGRDDT
jgi:hypothetical protein